jgi:hypothetical protein
MVFPRSVGSTRIEERELRPVKQDKGEVVVTEDIADNVRWQPRR